MQLQLRLIRLPEVKKLTGLCRSAIYEKIRVDFPRQVKIGDRGSAWVESEVEQWIASRIAARDAK
ncbi:MAG: AlpA family transcriptional regulator [Proteobacteria bacterium]|nr:AlpA family transcriptional regulator [Pseudomonadota bacterium]